MLASFLHKMVAHVSAYMVYYLPKVTYRYCLAPVLNVEMDVEMAVSLVNHSPLSLNHSHINRTLEKN